MISLESEHYIRLILLLIKGGSEALRETITSGLKKRDTSLDKILDDNKKEICSSKEISNIQQDILYPPSPHFTDISKWDISLLSYISLNFMGNVLTDMERKAAEKMIDIRNACQAYSENAEIETRKYTQHLSELSMAINTLTITMSEKSRTDLHKLLNRILSDQLDIDAAVEELNLLGSRDAFFESIQSSLEILQLNKDVESRENIAGQLEEAQIGESEVKGTEMDTEEDRKDALSSKNEEDTFEKETAWQNVKSYSEHHPKRQKKKRKKKHKHCNAEKESKRQSLEEQHAASFPSVTHAHEAISETISMTIKADHETDTTINQDKFRTMIFGQGKKQNELNKPDEDLTARMSNRSLFHDEEQSKKPNINESNENLNTAKGNCNFKESFVHANTNISDADKEMIQPGTETTQTNDQTDDGFDVDSRWKRQTRSMTKENTSHTENKQSSKKKKNLSWNQYEDRSVLNGQQPLPSSDIRVHFHMLLPTEFKFDSSKDRVVVRIGNDSIGGWNCNKHEMTPIGNSTTGHIEFTYEVAIPKHLIIGQNYLMYKYFVFRNTKTRKHRDRKNLWDHYYINGNAGRICNRELNVPYKWGSKEVWHQYDAVVNRKPKDGVFNWLSNFMTRKRKHKEDAEIAVKIYSGTILKCLNSDAIDMLEMLMHGLQRIYVKDAKCFTNETEMNTALGVHVLEPILCLFKNLNKTTTNETEAQWQHRMSVQLSLVAILKVTNLYNLRQDHCDLYSRLCKAYLTHPDPNKICKELEFLRMHYPNHMKFFHEAFVMLAKAVVKQKKDPAWLYIMPMVHFLSGSCKPFDAVTDDTAHASKVPVWWGTSDIGEDTTQTFKTNKSQKWEIPLQEVLQTLKTQFQMDFLLPRTFVASLNLEELLETLETEVIPVEVASAALVFFVKRAKQKTYLLYPTDDEALVCKCIETVLRQLHVECKNRDCADVTRWKVAAMVSLDLAKESIYHAFDSYLTATSVKVFLLSTSHYHVCLQNMNMNTQSEQERNIARLNEIFGLSINWLKLHYTYWEKIDPLLKVWGYFLLQNEAVLEEIEVHWNTLLEDELKASLSSFVYGNTASTEAFVAFYCKNADEHPPGFLSCLEEIALRALDSAFEIEYGTFGENGKKKFGRLLSKLFDTEFEKIMKRAKSIRSREFLEQVLSWKPFLQLIKMFYAKHYMDVLTDECKVNLIKTVSVIDTQVEELINGKIKIGDLLLFHKHSKEFLEIAQWVKGTVVEQEKCTFQHILKTALEIRKKECDELQSRANLMVSMTTLCRKLKKVDVSQLDNVLEKLTDINEHRLKDFCKLAVISEVKNIQEFKADISAFSITAEIETILPKMHKYKKSRTFQKFWDSECEQKGNSCTCLDDLISIWQPVTERLREFLHTFETGKILFCEFEFIVGRKFAEDYNGLAEELRSLDIVDRVIEVRIDQLKKYRHLEACRNGAMAFLKFKQAYQLTGDFSQLKLIATDADDKLQMEQFDDSFVSAFNILKDFTDERANCLNTFLKCQDLVKWLKESMHTSGLKELQVFVDLALMSVGDDPYNIGMVQALHSAVTGYAPLIFDLKRDCGHLELLELCRLVWGDLEFNPKLPKQLADTNCQLDWLKDIKEAHGSVEVTSMMQMEAINSDGTFTVCRRAPDKHRKDERLELNDLTVDDTIRLTVPEEKGKRQIRHYTFSQLQDLQSRLMLVAGKAAKGTENVERFTMIFDSITRLSKFYIKLISAGCVLFRDWSARFICDPDPRRPVCTVIDFGQSEDVPQLKGRPALGEDLKDMIPAIARFMECCHHDWLKHITEKRNSFLLLNYFTVNQLVILQSELVKFGTADQPSHLIFPLLSGIKPGCTEDDILQAMLSAKEEVEGKGDLKIESNEASEMEVEKEQTIFDTQSEIFIRNLVDAGQEEAMAIRALEHVDPEDFAQGILWCMEHSDSDVSEDDDMDVQTEASSKVSTGHSFQGWSLSEVSVKSLIENKLSGLGQQSEVGIRALIEQLENLWRQFLESISSNIKDYLSLEHLGIILAHLAAKNSNVIERNLPIGFREREPNLVVCPSDVVLPVALSIYMTSKEQPLPQSDEILMCTSNTTIDEVDIFFRRAFFENSKKIHCLLNIEFLTYDVSEVSERLLQDYIHRNDANYRLCVISGTDKRNRSCSMVSFLDKFQRQIPLLRMNQVRAYIAKKLVSSIDDTDRTAAFLDIERSTVRVIKSWRSGVGKSLFKKRKEKVLLSMNESGVKTDSVTVAIQQKNVNIHHVIKQFLDHTLTPGDQAIRLFHIDISHEVQEGVDYLLFNLLILGSLRDRTGYVWRKSESDLYLIEAMPILIKSEDEQESSLSYMHTMLAILPDVTCRSPHECMLIYSETRIPDQNDSDQLFDEEEFRSEKYQRPFQYLHRLSQGRNFNDIRADKQEGTQKLCLEILLRYCGVNDPSWAELHHFVWFLNTQLFDFTVNNFVSSAAAEDLPGFSSFVLKFLIQMSKDFSTRSLNISEESPLIHTEYSEHIRVKGEQFDDENADVLQLYQMRRTWESSPHPYLFFNWDKMAFTFLGFNIEKASGDLIDQQTGTILERCMMKKDLYEALDRNHVPLQENFNSLPREKQIQKLRAIMGVESRDDPDATYELTTDNVKKIMAIYMRFRCDIPVIIMGETGCGKTRLVKFMCSLQVPENSEATNMLLMKVHGGTTSQDIICNVRKAEDLARTNKTKYGDRMYTVLFFDEANSSEAIGLIKEIICDRRMEGQKLTLCENLKIVAACNPYRKHSEDLIKKLEMAGLGYHVDAENTTDRLGRVPMRRLVYRVQPLPSSLLPLVWDFGQLDTDIENLYIQQMVKRYIAGNRLPNIIRLKEVVSNILTRSQEFMRLQKDECSFVSLRDVERVLNVMSWFFSESKKERILFNMMDERLNVEDTSSVEEMDADSPKDYTDVDITRSLILALGVCYHACLKDREQYRAYITPCFQPPCQLLRGKDQILQEIECCQDVFLDHVDLEKHIARNMALKENVFMMIVCIELRIPLFLIGKPGSSKSLAKTIVSDAMRGTGAKHNLFKKMKQVKMVSYQCSPISTPNGIVGTFKQCAQFQKDKDLKNFVSVVVLDEVGLAEDSPRMPLKTLHPLLEDGCQGDDEPEDYMKVAFIGISNWALDPAKMNRGIVVHREVPDLEELINSARGICKTGTDIDNRMEPLIEPMALSYLELFNAASRKMREFFGLRDFYSLVKMVFKCVEKSGKVPTWHQMLHAIRRNFGGLDQVDPVDSFKRNLSRVVFVTEHSEHGDPDCSAAGLIRACLFDTVDLQSESRYLLLLTENYGALTIIQQLIQERSEDIRPITIFGSSFRCDQEYTQVCRNINKIKVCMETGNTVVLLNLENLYESLYDALNQYYVYFGDVRYVDLGLGTHRVKCPVHPHFRLIVVAEKQTVYKKFPIPLINRLEKHFLTINTMLTEDQLKLVSRLDQWASAFAFQRKTMLERGKPLTETTVRDVFIGFHDDTCSAIILHIWQKHIKISEIVDEERILHEAKLILLWSATPDALVRLEKSPLPTDEQEMLTTTYQNEQAHGSILDYLLHMVHHNRCKHIFAQITTHSKLLSTIHAKEISVVSGIDVEKILLIETLSSFDTEQQFCNKIRQHIQFMDTSAKMIVIQCDHGDVNSDLIECARYCIMDEFEKFRDELKEPVHVVLIIQIPKVSGGCFTGFQCGKWHSAHIDDLLPEDTDLPTVQEMHGKSIGMLIDSAVSGQQMMETDELIETANHAEEDMDWKEDNAQKNNLELEDIVFDLKNVRHHEDSSVIKTSTRGKLNVKKLILSCVQPALAMVKDKTEQRSRETDRVDLVIRLLHQDQTDGQPTFMQGICMFVAKLLQEKETCSGTAYNATNWLVNEAARLENINKTGTFRSSCIKVLESKIIPILAGVVAFCDTNENLGILEEKDCPWKQDVWLLILNAPGAIDIQYKDFQSPTRRDDLEEVSVTTTGSEGHAFENKMPFSWLFIDKITEVLKLDNPSADETEQDSYLEDINKKNLQAEACIRVLGEHPLCKVYQEICDKNIIHDASVQYLHDLVHTMYPAGSEEEFNMVFDTVMEMNNQLVNVIQVDNLLTYIVYIHVAFEALNTRLTYYHMLNVAWPECSPTIRKIKKENPQHFMFQENELTFTAVCLLVENISPEKSQLDVQAGRSKWLNDVHRYRSIVEKIIGIYDGDPTLYGASAAKIVRRIKALWHRVMVTKLFIEHVCVSDDEKNITVKFCTPLWRLLGEETDMKQEKSLVAVEKFLKNCYKGAMKAYRGHVVKCSDCDKVLEGPPITLPCKDVLCEKCLNDMRGAGRNTCANCKNEFADNWIPQQNVSNSNAETKLKDYQKRCNAFFLDVISQLCFSDKTPPCDEVIEKLLKYAFCEAGAKRQYTKELSVFDTGIDPNPVFRSFLLQLLLQTSEKHVTENLKKYLEEAENVVSEDMPNKEQMFIELSPLVIFCMEDKLMQTSSSKGTDDIIDAIKALDIAGRTIESQGLTVKKLNGLASARMGLAVTANCIATLVGSGAGGSFPGNTYQLLDSAKTLCKKATTEWPKKYLVKYLCRYYGIDVYQKACNCKLVDLRWLAITEMNKVATDRFIVYGEKYIELREALSKTLLGGTIDILQNTLLNMQEKGTTVETLLQLATFREITTLYVDPKQMKQFVPEVMTQLTEFVTECDSITNKELLLRLLQNQLVPRRLVVVEAEDLRFQGIQSLLIHFVVVMMHLKAENTLLQPLLTMIVNPQMYSNSYLPTMPQDEIEDIRQAILASKDMIEGNRETSPFYRCPNGHLYVIGECGRPYVTRKCHCGEEIGGKSHILLATNKVDIETDQTMTGHILGPPNTRGKGPKPERSLTPAQSSVIRLLIHMAMYLGTGNNIKVVQETIKPSIKEEEVEEFLWQHIQLDVEDIHRALTKSEDDVILFMHCVLHEIMTFHDPDVNVDEEVYLWSSKTGRRDWEDAFVLRFLQNPLKNMESLVQDNNQAITRDTRLGCDPLLCLLYETDHQTESLAQLQEAPSVWRYRMPVSIQHLRQSLEAETGSTETPQGKHKVLQLFLSEEYHLRALRFIPSILRLQRLLVNKFQKKLDKAEASQITVSKLKTDMEAGVEISQLLADFTEAWEMTRETLSFYLCNTEGGGATLPKECCARSITDNTPVSVLLPTSEGDGLCSYVLLDFLMRKQNNFLDKYRKETGCKHGKSVKVSPRDVTAAHLICYDPQHDLLTLVLANCKYTFKMGEGTSIEYDFSGLERQLMDRFLFSKSSIDVGPVLQIDMMTYRTELTNASVFKKLTSYIKQDSISSSVKKQICNETKSLPDICQDIYNLDIAISFLKTTGGSPTQNLHKYMKNTLQMKTTLTSSKAQQMIKLKHVQSLWLLLALQKSKVMTDNQHTREYTFESVHQMYNAALSENELECFNSYMRNLSEDKLSALIDVLHEFILLRVAVKQNTNDEDYTDLTENKMRDWLSAYIEEKEIQPLEVVILEDFPEEIRLKHSIHTWVIAYKVLKTKAAARNKY